jgi:hypothetical protein
VKTLVFLYIPGFSSVSIPYAGRGESAVAVDGRAVLSSAGASTHPISSMSIKSLPSVSTAPPQHGLVRSLEEAGLSRRNLIYVTGPGSLPALLWLCRQGFERAQEIQPRSPRCGVEPADALLIPHLSQARDLTALLPVAALLREGGVLLVRAGPRIGAAKTLATLAAPFGYDLRPHLADGGHAVYLARREGLAAQHRAA